MLIEVLLKAVTRTLAVILRLQLLQAILLKLIGVTLPQFVVELMLHLFVVVNQFLFEGLVELVDLCILGFRGAAFLVALLNHLVFDHLRYVVATTADFLWI